MTGVATSVGAEFADAGERGAGAMGATTGRGVAAPVETSQTYTLRRRSWPRGPGVRVMTATTTAMPISVAATHSGPTAAGTSYGTTSTTKCSNTVMPPT